MLNKHDRIRAATAARRGIYPARQHLFLDDLFVARSHGLVRAVQPPEDLTQSEPVLRAARAWEGVSVVFRCNCLLYDAEAELFKFWYGCEDPTLPDNPYRIKRRWAYATSPDGLHWDRPELGLVPYQGSTANNLVKFENVASSIALLQNVTLDRRDPDPAGRYKAIGLDRHPLRAGEQPWTAPGEDEWFESFGRHIGCGVFVSLSPDGLCWTMREGSCASGAIIADGSVLHGFDPGIGKWVLWQRPRILPKYRTMGMSVSEDFETWTFPADILAPDGDDPPGMQFDSLTTMAAPDGGYIGLAAASGLEGAGFLIAEKLPQLVFSRDGRSWTRVNRKPFMQAGDRSAWNGGPCIVPLQPIQVGDEVLIFYYGKNYGNMWGEPTLDGKGITEAGLGLAKLPRDRWVAMTPETAAGGQLTTPLVAFCHNELHVNVRAARGTLRVELLDYDDRPLPGYTLDDCDPVREDCLDRTVTWQGTADLSAVIGTALCQPLAGRALRLRFALDRADLFGFAC